MGLSWKFGHASKIEAFAVLNLKRSSFGLFVDKKIKGKKVIAHSIPTVPLHPPPGHLSGSCHLVCPGGGDLSENLCLGVGRSSILLEAVKVVPFSIFH